MRGGIYLLAKHSIIHLDRHHEAALDRSFKNASAPVYGLEKIGKTAVLSI